RLQTHGDQPRFMQSTPGRALALTRLQSGIRDLALPSAQPCKMTAMTTRNIAALMSGLPVAVVDSPMPTRPSRPCGHPVDDQQQETAVPAPAAFATRPRGQHLISRHAVAERGPLSDESGTTSRTAPGSSATRWSTKARVAALMPRRFGIRAVILASAAS